ncbi:hypothetical protein CRYUN_Cryun02cG0090600 [Craigia yunnanensis]
MAGMLSGVECARRRRFHQSGRSFDSPSVAAIGSTKRSSFCLYTSNHETHHSSVSSQFLVFALITLFWALKIRQNSKENLNCMDGRSLIQGELHTEVFGSKKSGQKRFNWTKLSWKASDQNECVICLEQFKASEILVHLLCAHRFHSRCLVPWLENYAHCPCYRMGILS